MSGIADVHSAVAAPARVLVVEDSATQAAALALLLERAGYDTVLARRADRALALLEEQRIDLVLSDVVMPGMDGYEVCIQLKADATTRDIPVIFVTAHNDEQAETRGLASGAVDFIAKPINPAVVRARVKTHLTLKAQSDLLRQMAFIDGLTGVANRRHFDARFASEWRRSVRSRTPLTLMLIDVDFFKRYNDIYGHQAGDDCLRTVAGCIAAGLRRPGDLLARYGGEEFACVLPETGTAGACMLAQALEAAVRGLALPHPGSDVAGVVTVSVGAAVKGAEAAGNAEHLLALADTKLYEAKAEGRARVVSGELPTA